MLRVHELRKRFGSLVAVAGVSFELRAGETFGLLGPNGAGKSTTIGMIVGAIQPDGGEVMIDGAGTPAIPEARRRIGVAPQSLSLYADLTAQENLRFFGQLYGLRGGRLAERVDWALELAGLIDRQKSRVKTFSGGMKRRLNLACAMVHAPRLLLLDEPTVGVDPQSRSHIFTQIERFRDEGCTVIYTTHYMEEAQRLCDRVAIMDHGRILAMDSVEALIAAHGGTSVVTAELAHAPDDPGALPGRIDQGLLRFETPTPLEDIGRMASAGVRFASLQVNRPDLETVFLSLTGRSLRD